jgi:hypothetical protein
VRSKQTASWSQHMSCQLAIAVQALGTDLTTLGLNLNSPDQLHKTFASPWADGPLKAEPDFKVWLT